MVTKEEIGQVALVRGLGPHVVEKDYLLGWVLAGIYQHVSLKNNWIFKGDTSFMKSYWGWDFLWSIHRRMDQARTHRSDWHEQAGCSGNRSVLSEDMEAGRCFNPGYTDPESVDRRWRIDVEVCFGGMIG